MRALEPTTGEVATFHAVTSVGKTAITDKSVGSDENWFSDMVLRLLGREKPGTALDCVTGLTFGERNCQRYASGEVKPPGYFVRALIRSDNGEPFFRALMQGCDAEWWLEYERHRAMGEAADNAGKR